MKPSFPKAIPGTTATLASSNKYSANLRELGTFGEKYEEKLGKA